MTAVIDFDLVAQLVTAGALGTLIGTVVPDPLTPNIEHRAAQGTLLCPALTAVFVLVAETSSAADGVTPVVIGAGALLLYLLFVNLTARVLGRGRHP